MHMITRSCVLLLWSQLMTSVSSQDCTLEQFIKSAHFDSNFDISGLGATYSGGKQVRVPCSSGYTGFFRLICSEGNWMTAGKKCEPKSCGHPGDAPYADFRLVQGDDFVFGSEIVYECNRGYQMVSRFNRRRCLADGWDGIIPVCEAIKCPVIHADNNVHIFGDAEEATSGNVVRFSCKSNAEILSGSQEIFCKDDGEWSDPVPKCKAIGCSVPQIEHGRVLGAAQEYKEHEILHFRCDSTYKWAVERTPRCTKTGQKANWIPTPACKKIQCELTLASIRGTTYSPPNKNMYSPGETVRVTCGEKHWILDMQTTEADITCGVTGEWNSNPICQEVTCPYQILEEHLYNYENARGKNKLGDRIWYQCASYYNPANSDRMATCTRDGWTPKPLCVGTRCENPNIKNSRIIRGYKRTYNQGDQFTYQCLRGNQESVTITCNRGAWNGIIQCTDVPVCQKPEITNGFAVESTNGTIYYTCNENFKLPTKSWWGYAKCEDGGFGQLHSCIAKTSCGEPQAISNGKVTVLSNRGKIECNEGYFAVIPELTCENGRWNYHGHSSKKICNATAQHCGPPPKVENAIVTVSYQKEYLHGSSVTYQCRDKYVMEEEPTITCRDGKWERSNITCASLCEKLSDTRLKVRADMIKEIYMEGEVVQYECTTPGANKEGNATCQSGKWTISEKCPGIPCKVDPLSDGLRHFGRAPRYNLVNPGKKLRFLCGDEYDMQGSEEVQCLDTGKWDGPFPNCSEKCKRSDVPDNIRIISSIQGNFVSTGDTVSFACRQQEHIMQGSKESRCLGNGKWSPSLPQCAAVQCSAPPLLEDGDTKLFLRSNAVYQTGDKVEYICQNKYIMNGDPFQTCNNGVWEGNMRCMKPCTVNEELLSQHGLYFRVGGATNLYAPHEDHLSFVCLRGKRRVGSVPLRVQCNDGQMTLPTCQ
ncbi:sushi, von Willebrand factor type A, EGF and pentraxin domain-containing protein 1-like isoform X2 [Poeciliopsis prolifica]|uniref:sushi, von Willebrand factor type A, EGF and pentraxin domain-containing protein 1-like isoform X2 n=1 Tax=Poeciliopsis prolifica TaxID=188132 RepID=UPI0024138C4D|nr:sushi, von Willebrand factor type A, EGF and pentraxin domain-containing protein 1-like isoform X2 [Poeciliopsis prolifica]